MPRRRTSPSLPFVRKRSTRWLVGALILLAIAGALSAISRNGAGPQGVPKTTGTPSAVASRLTAPPSISAPTTTPAGTPTVTSISPELHPEPSRLQPARVVRVVDGDTIDVEIDGREERVRYYGIDTPERGDECFSQATARNKEIVGESVLLLSDARDRDRYDRILRYVFDAQGNSVDARLIAEGFARAWREDGAYRDQLVSLEAQADAADIGCLWQ